MSELPKQSAYKSQIRFGVDGLQAEQNIQEEQPFKIAREVV